MARYFAVVGLIVTAGVVIFRGGDPLDGRSLSCGAQIAEEALVETIARGNTVDIESHLEDGEWTVVEFYADW